MPEQNRIDLHFEVNTAEQKTDLATKSKTNSSQLARPYTTLCQYLMRVWQTESIHEEKKN